MNFKHLSFIGLAFVMGCSMVDDMKSMQDKTTQMAESTKQMSDDVHQTEQTADDTYKGLRAVDARLLRAGNDAMSCVRTSPYLAVKLACANTYFYGFEFQTWRGYGTDDPAKLDALKALAVKEFFQLVRPFLGPNKYVWQDWTPLNPNMEDIYAFVANLHQVYPDQLFQARKMNFPVVSMYSLIQEALRDSYMHPDQAPETMSKWSYYIRANKKDALDLLHKRVTFLPFLSYALFTELDKKSQFKALWDALTTSDIADEKDRPLQLDSPWVVDVKLFDRAELDLYISATKAALMTRQFLNSINEDAVPDNNFKASLGIKTIYGHLKITNSGPKDEAARIKMAMMSNFQNLAYLLWAPREEFSKIDPALYQVDLTAY